MDRSNDIKKLWALIKDVKVAMMTTAEPDGALHSRPMATQEREFDGDLWFFTSINSAKVNEVRQNQHVNLSYADPDDNQYVSVSGTAQIVRDRQKTEELWSPIHRAWFPKGIDDPELALIRVAVDKAEYWDSPSSTMVQLIGFVKAMASGKRYEADAGEHGKVNL
jgi:general stress protein 26